MQTRIGDRGLTSVFIIAASDVVRAGLETLIAEEGGFTVAGSAVDLSALAAPLTDDESPDVVIFDAERHGEETLDSLKSYVEGVREGHIPALIVIGAEQEEWLREALRSGVVHATLPQAASSGEIIAAVAAVSTGLIVLDAEMFAAVLSPSTSTVDDSPNTEPYDQRLRSSEPLLEELTPREHEVLEMLAEGLSNKEIAWRMKISEHTIKFHVASIFSKLGASTRTEAVMLGLRSGLLMM